MFLTFGDVLAVVAGLIGICLSTWALVLGSALFFEKRCGLARDAVQTSALKSFLLGLVLTFSLGLAGLVILQVPNPAVKLLGWTILMSLMALASCGVGGLTLLAAERVRTLDPAMSQYGAVSRAAAILVVSGLVPFLGWFFVAPIVFLVGLGAGVQAVFSRARQAAPQLVI